MPIVHPPNTHQTLQKKIYENKIHFNFSNYFNFNLLW